MRASVEEIPLEMQLDAIETRGVEWEDQLVRHIDLPPGVDFTPLFVGLPGNLCQCPHWGYIVEGSIHLRYADGTEEVNRAGDVVLLARRAHRMDRRRRRVRGVQPDGADPPGARAPRRAARAVDLTTFVAVSEAELDDARAASAACRLAGRARRGHARSGRRPARRGRAARAVGRRVVVARPPRRLHRRTVRPRTGRTRTSAITAAPASARSGSTSTTASRPDPPIASAWLQRARRALEDDTECVEYGALVLREAEVAHGGGDLETAGDRPPRWSSSAAGSASTDLEAEALQALGRVLIDRGDTARRAWRTSTRRCCSRSRAGCGTTRPARSTAASSPPVRSSATSPRASEWTEATARWAERAPVRGLPRHLPRPPRQRAQLAR